MEISIKGKISTDPRDRVIALEACVRAICEKTGQDPAEGVMMLLTAAAHMFATYSGKPIDQTAMGLARSLGAATVAAEGFFSLRPVRASQSREERT
jgi:hypothetical protein